MSARHRRLPLHAFALACLAVASSGCADQKGPPLKIVIARGAQGGRCAAGADVPLTTQRLRLSVVRRTATAPELLCDRIVQLPNERPTLKLELKGAGAIDIYGEAFRVADASDPDNDRVGLYRREATGAILNLGAGVSTTEQRVLRLYPSEEYRCGEERLAQPRAFHSATALPNGQVLIIGGAVASATDTTREQLEGTKLYLTGSVELYDPTDGTVRPIMEATPGTPRAFHEALLVGAEPPYQILLVGGVTVTDGSMPALASTVGQREGARLIPFDTSQAFPPAFPTKAAPAELVTWDPVAATLTREPLATGPKGAYLAAAARAGGVITVGGIEYGASNAVDLAGAKSIRRYTPGGTPQTIGALNFERVGARVALLSNDAALVWGGARASTDSPGEVLSGLGGMPTASRADVVAPRVEFPTLTRLPDVGGTPTFLATGGFVATMNGIATQPPAPDVAIQRIQVAGAVVTATAIAPGAGFSVDTTCTAANRYRPAGYESAVRLRSGEVLVSGGAPTLTVPPAAACNDCEAAAGLLCATTQSAIFDPTTNTFARTLGALGVARAGHTMTELADGNVLVVGGLQGDKILPDVEVFNPRTVVPRYELARPEAGDADDPIADLLKDSSFQRAPGELATNPSANNTPVRPCPLL
jgi:hypothetical protein